MPISAPAGAGTPVKKLPDQSGRLGSSIITLKRASRSAAADREHHARDPADVAEVVQAPEIQDQARRAAKVDEIGKAVELGAEARLALDHARDPAVDAVEEGGEHDQAERQFEPLLECEPNRGEARAQREQRDHVR